MNKAAFSLVQYRFERINIDFSKNKAKQLEIGFNPSGKFYLKNFTFELTFSFIAYTDGIENPFIEIECISLFKFQDKLTFAEIPPYFYRNSIAIIFPYIRAFISTVTLQANIPPLIFPTMNLSDLEEPLRSKTIEVN